MLKTAIFRYCTLCFFAVPLRPGKVANTTVLSLVMTFALQDLFGQKSAYGDFQGIIERLQTDNISEIHYADSATEIPIPKWLRVSGMMPGVGIIYGKK